MVAACGIRSVQRFVAMSSFRSLSSCLLIVVLIGLGSLGPTARGQSIDGPSNISVSEMAPMSPTPRMSSSVASSSTTRRRTTTTTTAAPGPDFVDIAQDVISGVIDSMDLSPLDTSRDAHEVWKDMSKRLRDLVSSVVRMLLPRAMEYATEVELTPDCTGTMLQVVFALRRQKVWAFQLLDASGLVPSGILEGRMTNLGNFDECMSIEAREDDNRPDSELLFRGQYCLVTSSVVLPPQPDKVTFRTRVFNFTSTELENTVFMELSKFAQFYYGWKPKLGLCIPSTCTKGDLQNIFGLLANNLGVQMNVTSCQLKEPVTLNVIQQAFLITLCVLLVLVVLGTIVETISLLRKHAPPRGKIMASICCFSAYRNTVFLLTAPVVDKTLSCIHGIQALEMMWLMISLCYLLYDKTLMGGTRRYAAYVEDVSTQGLMIGYQLVDRIMMISAMGMAYFQFQLLRRQGGSVSLMRQIFFHLLTVWPSLLFAIGFAFVWPLVGSGPLWEQEVIAHSKQCTQTWWKTALFFSNWLPSEDTCLPHTFYVSVTMQLFLVFLFVPKIIYSWPKIGLALNAFLGISGLVASGFTSYLDKIPGIPLANTVIQNDYTTESERTHYRTYFHLGPYALGVFLAYLFNREKKISIHPIVQTALWLMVPAATLLVVYLPLEWHRGKVPEGSLPILYGALSRTVFCFPLMWILYACGTGRGGPINRFLSWSGFVPMGRLWYLIYLSHVIVIYTRNAMFRQTITLTHYDMACEWAAIVMITMAVSSVVHIVVEAPFSRLADVWLFWKSRYEDDDDD